METWRHISPSSVPTRVVARSVGVLGFISPAKQARMSQVLEKQRPSAGLSTVLVSSQDHLFFVNHDLSWPIGSNALPFLGVSLLIL